MKIIYSWNTSKNFSDFTNFPANMLLCIVRKNIYTTLFQVAQELHCWSTLKANVCIFLYISIKRLCFRDVVRFYLVGGGGGCGMGWDWINFLRWFAVWALQNVLQCFILIEIFENSTIFSISVTSIYSIKTLKFSRQFGLWG